MSPMPYFLVNHFPPSKAPMDLSGELNEQSHVLGTVLTRRRAALSNRFDTILKST